MLPVPVAVAPGGKDDDGCLGARSRTLVLFTVLLLFYVAGLLAGLSMISDGGSGIPLGIIVLGIAGLGVVVCWRNLLKALRYPPTGT